MGYLTKYLTENKTYQPQCATIAGFLRNNSRSVVANNRVDCTEAIPGAQKCEADGSWYSCSCPRCKLTRSCSSNPGLTAYACPVDTGGGGYLYGLFWQGPVFGVVEGNSANLNAPVLDLFNALL